MNHKENLNLVFNLPELHPRSHTYDSSFKFVGPCIDSKLHLSGNLNQSISDSVVSNLVDYFKPIDRENVDNKKPILIYFSLGTVFNDNLDIFKTIIDGICLYLKGVNSSRKQIKVLISSGGLNENERINDLIISNDFKDSFIVCKAVPQLEILERCSLFITHCGMNSINEAVYYGCPMVI
jgi:UDP:flavonoid glycosyltransferase YjiC (YdhE family)